MDTWVPFVSFVVVVMGGLIWLQLRSDKAPRMRSDKAARTGKHVSGLDDTKVFTYACRFMIGLGALAMAAGVVWTWQRSALVIEGEWTKGQVVALQEEQGFDDHDAHGRRLTTPRAVSYYYPVVEFTAKDGRQIRFKGSTGSNPPSYKVGEAVEVVYDPVRPEGAQITSFMQLWAGPLAVLGLGFVPFGLGLVGLRLFAGEFARLTKR